MVLLAVGCRTVAQFQRGCHGSIAWPKHKEHKHMMLDMLNTIDFHLLRPWWLIAILPALALAWFLLKHHTDTSGWAAVIDSELLTELLDGQQQVQKKWPMLALLLAWILAACAIAGPCFEKNNQAALKQADAVVILLDLSPSMLAQ